MASSDQKLSVTFVIPYFYPAWQYGGQPRSAFELARALVLRGHRVKVLTTDSGGQRRLSADQIGDGSRTVDGVEVVYYRNVSNWLAFRQRLFFPVKMFRDFDRELTGADLLHIHELRSTLSVPACRAALRLQVPYLVSTHGGLRHLGKRWLKKLFDAQWGRRILEQAEAIIAISPVEEDDARSFPVDPSRIRRLPNLLRVSDYGAPSRLGLFRRKWNLGNAKVILFIGRLHWIKGADLLIRAFERSGLWRSDVHLVIAGNDDGQERELRRMTSQLKLDRAVTFTGFLQHDEKLSAFADAVVTVTPSRSEVFAISAIEALLCECPVILSNACGLSPMPRPEQGVRLFKSESVEDLADALCLATGDASFKKAAAAGREFVRAEFGDAKVAERAESIYREILKVG